MKKSSARRKEILFTISDRAIYIYVDMEKQEWRETFNKQPIHYLFFDFSAPISINSVNTVCQVLQNLTALSNSLKGSSRFTMLGVYVLSSRTKCIFPLQSVKHNFMKLQISLESMQALHSLPVTEDNCESNVLTEILKDAVKQYETYFQNAVLNSEEWPQIQMMFFSSQSSQNFLKMIEKALSCVHLAYISKVHVVILRKRGIMSSNNSLSKIDSPSQSSPVLFGVDEDVEEISSLIQVTETDGNIYQIENIMKQWLHDFSTDSDHLRLNIGNVSIRCDIKECMLNADALPVSGQFYLLPDGSVSQNVVRPISANKQTSASKVPLYVMDAIAIVQKEGMCESLLFGHSYIATATRCWKIDWDELDRNQQLFLAITQHLYEKGQVLIAKKKTAQIMPSEKVLPTGFFAFFPTKNMLLIKSVAPNELILPKEETPEKEIPYEVTIEAKECLENLEHKTAYNPLTMTSGLYSYLATFQAKKMRPTTSFVAPIPVSHNEDRVEGKKRKKLPVASTSELISNKRAEMLANGDFMSASALLKRKFPQEFD